MSELRCWNCGHGLDDVPLPISRHATCAQCFNELHCCRLCRHYQPDATSGQCAEDRADPPVIKDTANFCDWFRPSSNAFSERSHSKGSAAKAQLDALFGGEVGDEATDLQDSAPPNQTQAEDARAKLDALFGENSDKKPTEN